MVPASFTNPHARGQQFSPENEVQFAHPGAQGGFQDSALRLLSFCFSRNRLKAHPPLLYFNHGVFTANIHPPTTGHISQRLLVLVAGGYLLILRFTEVIPFSMFMYRYLEPGRARPPPARQMYIQRVGILNTSLPNKYNV